MKRRVRLAARPEILQDQGMAKSMCVHLAGVASVKPALRYECAECVKAGGQWVHLRTCQACGVTHCCDQSPGRHARHHAAATGHSVVASAEPGERWLYCFEDDEFHDY